MPGFVHPWFLLPLIQVIELVIKMVFFMLAPVEHIYNTLWCRIPEDGKLPWETVEICKKYHFFM
jgi:hypothetical protein